MTQTRQNETQQADRQTDRQIGRQTDRQTVEHQSIRLSQRHTDKETQIARQITIHTLGQASRHSLKDRQEADILKLQEMLLSVLVWAGQEGLCQLVYIQTCMPICRPFCPLLFSPHLLTICSKQAIHLGLMGIRRMHFSAGKMQ